jgi:hypothetical protein
MNKKLKETKQYGIEFTEEEIAGFGWKNNQKFEVTENEDGSILLEPYKKVTIDLDLLDKGDLVKIIQLSCEMDISTGEVIALLLLEGEEEEDESETNI